MPSNARGLGVTTMGPTVRRGKPPPRPPRYGVARLGGGQGALAAGMCLVAEVPGRISFSELSISHEIF